MVRVFTNGKAVVIFALGLLVLAGALTRAQETPSEYAPPDTVFREIRLSDAGVNAVDTAGNDWYYDFTLGSFKAGAPEDASNLEGSEDGEDPAIDYVPVEDRNPKEIKVKPFVSRIVVGYDEYVSGDIIAYGRVTIRGWVKGSVTSIDGRVFVARTGRIDGDVTAPEIIVRDGGEIRGAQIIADTIDPSSLMPKTSSSAGIILLIVFTLVFVFFGFLVVTLMPRQMENFTACVEHSRLKMYFTGLFFVLLMPFVLLLVAITIVGIVLLPIVVLAYVLAMVFGVIAFGSAIGRTISQKFVVRQIGPLLTAMTGIFGFMALWFLTAALLSSSSKVIEGFGIFALVVSIGVSSYPIFTGVGASIMTRFGFRSYVGWKDRPRPGAGLAPAPPPIPKAPPEPTPGAFDDINNDETSGSSQS